MKSRAWLLTLFLLFAQGFPVGAQDEISDLLGRVNNLRVSLGLPAYGYNGALAAAAQDQAQWMVDTGSVSHTRPDGSNPRSRATAAGYPSTWVSENIYGGSNATANDAWSFWMNSSIHYAGITSANNFEIGIGAAHGGWGAAYVLVFGNPGGQSAQPRSSNSGNNGGNSSAPAVPEQPIYVVGTDEYGNIMHEIQPGDTMGDIALIYGYTWDDIPAILALNKLTEEDFRNLEIGTILLIPPQSGTYTPTPGEPTATVTYELPATFTQTPTPTMTPDANSVDNSTSNPGDQGILPTFTATPTPYTRAIVTANALPAAVALAAPTALETPSPIPSEPSPAEMVVASAPTVPVSASTPSVIITTESTSPWLIAGLVLQVGVLAYASFEFIRRIRRR